MRLGLVGADFIWMEMMMTLYHDASSIYLTDIVARELNFRPGHFPALFVYDDAVWERDQPLRNETGEIEGYGYSHASQQDFPEYLRVWND